MELSRWWPLAGAEELREELLAAYRHPSRRYHDLRHLAEVLGRIDEVAAAEPVAPTAEQLLAVRLAAWFHDAVYDGQPGAEERSAAWAEAALPGVGVDAATAAEVARLVRLTESHLPAETDPTGCLLSDADLGILAAPAGRYRGYALDVRAEYAQVPDDLFAAARADVLRRLLAKPSIFHTTHARGSWEEPARRNLLAELAELASR